MRYDHLVSLTFLHAADLHLDSPMKGLREINSPLAQRFAQSTNAAFEKMISLAIEHQVEAVLLSGDLYDRKDRSLKARFVLADGLKKLHQAKIKTFIVHGNHDPLSGADEHLLLPDSVFIFQGHHSHFKVTSRTGLDYVVQGISYLQSEMTQNLSMLYRRVDDCVNIGLLHANVGHDTWHQNYSACTTDDLDLAQLDYWALGHVHTHKIFELDHGAAAYPGNLQARHRAEMGPKGCLLVTLDETRTRAPKIERLICDVLRWHVLEFDLATVSSIDALLESITLQSAQVMLEAKVNAAVVGVRLLGGGTLCSALKRVEAKEAFEERLNWNLSALNALLERVDYDFNPHVDAATAGLLSDALSSGNSQDADALWVNTGLEDLDLLLAPLGIAMLDRSELLLRAKERLWAELASP